MHAAPLALLLLASSSLRSAAAAQIIRLPGCPTRCGDVSVPYPFGIGPKCGLPGLNNLTCDTSSKPPRLTLGGGDDILQVTDISLSSATLRVQGPGIGIQVDPFVEEASGTWGGPAWGLTGGSAWILSPAHNEFIVTGCGIFANLVHADLGKLLINSCGSVCGPGTGLGWAPTNRPGGSKKCSGISCCQTPITTGCASYDVKLTTLDYGLIQAPGGGTLFPVFIAEEGWFDGSDSFDFSAKFDASRTKVPAVLAWLISSGVLNDGGPQKRDGDATCPRDLGTTACHSSYSSCTSTTLQPYLLNGQDGYLCKCWDGYQGNPYLADGCQDIDECALPDKCYGTCENIPGNYSCQCPQGTTGDPYRKYGCVELHPSNTGLIIGLAIGGAAGLLILVLGSAFLVHKIKERRKKRQRQMFFKQNRGQLLHKLISQNADIAERMIITLEELEKATNNFDKSRELGGGGHGTVYKGILSSLHVVAIKRSKIVVQREIDDFINEVAILSQINHKNIVKLHGCCLQTEVPLLVYQFISNGTLFDHLHIEAPMSLSWKHRLRIAVEIARALTYLHSLVSLPIIHRDIKSPNILLDENLTVKLSDFGASRYIPVDQSGVHTAVQGTLGYLDPMYHSSGHLTEKSDVYSFGVLLIELLTRKKPVSYRSRQGYSLVKQFSALVSEGKIFDILDPQVAKEGDGEVVDVALLAAICVKSIGEERPTMRQVEMALEGIRASKEDVSSDTDTTDNGYVENWIQANIGVGETDMENTSDD